MYIFEKFWTFLFLQKKRRIWFFFFKIRVKKGIVIWDLKLKIINSNKIIYFDVLINVSLILKENYLQAFELTSTKKRKID